MWFGIAKGVCIDIGEIWFGIASGQILSIFDSYLPVTCPYFRFRTITSVSINEFSPNLIYEFLSFFDKVICPLHDSGGVLYFQVFISQ